MQLLLFSFALFGSFELLFFVYICTVKWNLELGPLQVYQCLVAGFIQLSTQVLIEVFYF